MDFPMSDESDYRNSWIGGGRGTTGPLNYPPLDEQYKSREGAPLYNYDLRTNSATRVDSTSALRGVPIQQIKYEDVVAVVGPPTVGVRHDSDKTQWGLLDWDFVEEITRGLMYGAKKYTDPYNYQKGLSYSRVFRAAMSHLTKWWRGTEIDEESGVHHLALVCCNALFAWYYATRPDKYKEKFDDRPRA